MRKEKRSGSPRSALPAFGHRKSKQRTSESALSASQNAISRQQSVEASSMPSGSPISPHSADLPAGVDHTPLSSRLVVDLVISGNISLASQNWPEVPEGGCSPGGAPANEVAFRMLQEHVALVVCSYCSPEVFDNFLQEHLPEENVQAIHQTMRGISKLLDDEGKRRFGEVILGRRTDDDGPVAEETNSAPRPATEAKGRTRAFSFSVRSQADKEKDGTGTGGGSDAEECWAVRTGGLLHGSDTLLRAFVQEHKQFAEYLSLNLVNPIVVSSLEFASTKWAELHPPEPGPVLEPFFSRILVTPEGVRIRGGSSVALHRNLQSRFDESEWRGAVEARQRLAHALSDVLLGKTGRDKRSRMRKAFDKVGGKGKKEKEITQEAALGDDPASSTARVGLMRLEGVDPHSSPAGLICHDLSLVKMLLQRESRTAQKNAKAPKSGSRAHRLHEALLTAAAVFEDLQGRDARGEGLERAPSFARRHSAPPRPPPEDDPDSPHDGETRGRGFSQGSDDYAPRDGSPTSGASTPRSADWENDFTNASTLGTTSFCGNPMHNRSVFDARIGFSSSAPTGGGSFLSP